MYKYKELTLRERQLLLEYRKQMGFPLHSPPHLNVAEGWYIITASTYYHKHVFGSSHLLKFLETSIIETLCEARKRYAAWVVMPNHYHILVELKSTAGRYGRIAQKLHTLTAFYVNRMEDKKGRKVWYRYSDRLIRSERHFYATLNYIHFNPQKHGRCESFLDWQWSSVHKYLVEFGKEWVCEMLGAFPIDRYGVGWDEFRSNDAT